MAKVLEGVKEWSAQVRCADAVCGVGLNKVEGCFALLEVKLSDFEVKSNEEDSWYVVLCPACGHIIMPQWQIGLSPADVVRMQHNEKRKRR